MGDHVAVNETIWPSQNDVAQTAGQGKNLLENQWAKPVGALGVNNLTLTGFTVAASDADLVTNVALGTAYISGRHITVPAATAVTAAASNTNHVFLKLSRDGSNLVTGAVFEVNTTGTPPADSVYLCTLTTDTDNITATADKRILPTTITVLTSGTSWPVPAGITRVYTEVLGASGGGGGGGEGSPNSAAGQNGTAGGAGGTTTFDVLTTTGGAAGGLGLGTHNAGTAGTAGASHGVGSGGTINTTGGGKMGGNGGRGGASSTTVNGTGGAGGRGGDGGYSAGYLTVTPGDSITTAIGAAGSAGSGGTGTAAGDGGAGRAGQAGVIVIRY
jgi:hypothetical protein